MILKIEKRQHILTFSEVSSQGNFRSEVKVNYRFDIGGKLALFCIYPHERWDLRPFEIWNWGRSPSSDQGITILVNYYL